MTTTVNRAYVDAEGYIEDGNGHRFEDQDMINFHIGKSSHKGIEGTDEKKAYPRFKLNSGEFYTIEPIQVEIIKPLHQRPVARIVTEEEKPMPTINDTYWTAMLTLSARIPKGASLLLAYETDQAICVTNSKTPEHHSCTEMGCINDSHVIYRLPKVEYALLDKPIKFPQPAPVVDKPDQELSQFSNSAIGSHHWAATLLSFIMRVGEYMNKHGVEKQNDIHYRDWGRGLKDRATEINNYLQSLPEPPKP